MAAWNKKNDLNVKNKIWEITRYKVISILRVILILLQKDALLIALLSMTNNNYSENKIF